MSTIFDVLREDHDRQRELIDALLETEGTSGDRAELFAELKRELSTHANHEERHFYAPLIHHDLTQSDARHGVAEHKELDDLVERLEGYDMSGPAWIGAAEDLAHKVRHHLDEEEREFFPVAGKALSDDEKVALGGAYRAAMDDERSSA